MSRLTRLPLAPEAARNEGALLLFVASDFCRLVSGLAGVVVGVLDVAVLGLVPLARRLERLVAHGEADIPGIDAADVDLILGVLAGEDDVAPAVQPGLHLCGIRLVEIDRGQEVADRVARRSRCKSSYCRRR